MSFVDYHIHTRLSGDAQESNVEAVCKKAIEIGLDEISFAEHVDFDPSDLCYRVYDYAKARNEIEEARERFGDKLIIRHGVEVDYQTRFHNQVEDFIANHEFDYVIGSAHYINGIILVDDACFKDKSEAEVYMPYFDLAESLVETGLFDALAHLEFCKRVGVRFFGPFNFERYEERITGVLQAVINNNIALELNTSGLRQDPGEPFPSFSSLRCFKELGGRKIVIGSDAHRIQHVGSGIEEGYRLAREAGFAEMATFEKRNCRLIPIPSTSLQRAEPCPSRSE